MNPAAPEEVVHFSGEESGRFCRFGVVALSAGLEPAVIVDGREPLTHRPLHIEGRVTDAKVDGYMRYLVVTELASGLQYWIAGSNATRSIAASDVRFRVTPDDLSTMTQHASASGTPIPGVGAELGNVALEALDVAARRRSTEDLKTVVQLLHHEDHAVREEAAMVLRSFEGVLSDNRPLRRDTERSIIATVDDGGAADTIVYLVEDLGYIGSSACIPLLGRLLSDESQHEHVRWAAAIALGRLQGEAVIDLLMPGLAAKHEWTMAATLLGLSRRARPETRARLEPVLRQYLDVEATSKTLVRYACLGLSRFDRLENETLSQLRELLGDGHDPAVAGFAALAMSGSLRSCPLEVRDEIAEAVRRLAIVNPADLTEPEAIWGTEFLAELATLLELNERAAEYHEILADLFSDWRSAYCEAVALYERGEHAVRVGDGEAAIGCFAEARERLATLGRKAPEEEATIRFRQDIVTARLRLYEIIDHWATTVDAADLGRLAEELRDVSRVYQMYSTTPGPRSKAKQLSQRELDYMRSTRHMVEMIRVVMSMDAAIRGPAPDLQRILGETSNLLETLEPLSAEFRASLAMAPAAVVSASVERLSGIRMALVSSQFTEAEKVARARPIVGQLRDVLRKATWPMPARACPVGGLGRGSLIIHTEERPGSGAQDDPVIFDAGGPPLLNVTAVVDEMAPGGSATALIRCVAAGVTATEPVPVVESRYLCTFPLPREALSSSVATRAVFSLEFEARDCRQVTDTQVLFVKERRPD